MNNKILIWILAMVLLVSVVVGESIVLQQINTDVEINFLYNNVGGQVSCQSFQVNETYAPTKFEIWTVDTVNGGVDNRWATIYEGSVSTIDRNSVVTNSTNIIGGALAGFTRYNFTFDGLGSVVPGQNYSICFERDTYNALADCYGSDGSYPGGTWTDNDVVPIAGRDIWFQLYADTSSDSSSLKLFNPTILNNTQYDYTPLDFNVTMNATNSTSCGFYLNGALNDTNAYIAGNNTIVSFSENLTDGTYTYNISCTDGTNNASIGTYTFFIDTIEPRVIHNFLNNSLYYLANITFDLNISDDVSIFSYNVSIGGVTGQYEDNILQTSYNASISLDITGLNVGDHILNIKASDGHTAKKLKGDYKFNNGLLNDYAKYSFEDVYSEGEIMIYQKDGSIFDSWSSEKKTDRYSFKFKPNTKKTSYTFVIEAEGDISIVELPHTKYQQWLIYKDHWLDFMPYADVNFKRLDTNQVEVTVKGIDPNLAEIEFNSIGDLNTVELNYSFTTINVSETFESPIVSNNPTTLTLKINDTTQQGDIFSTLLEWDGTNYTAVYEGIISDLTTYSYDLTIPGVATTINKTHNWWIETTGYETTSLQNQTVYPVNLALCDATHTNPVLNVTYRDEVDDAILNVTNAYSMKFTDNINWTNISNTYTGTTIGFCTDLPDDITYNWNVHGNFNMQRAGYVNRFYTIDEGSPLGVSNNPGKNLTLYLVKINESSTVTYTWRTSTYTPIDGILRIYHCDLDGTKNLVESLQITSGTAVGNIVLFTEQYAYEVIYEDEVYNNGGTGWGTCHIESATDASYMIDVGAVTIIQPVGMSSIRCSLDKTSNTTVEMTWNQNEEDSTYVSGCISAYRQDIYGSILVYENCSESGYSLEVAVPTSGYDYIIQGELKQGNYTVGCRDSVSFNFAEFGGSIFGNISTLIAVFFLVAALILFYAGEGELMIGAAIVGVVLSWIIGILFLPWLQVTAMIAFLIVIVLVGRNTR